MIYYTGIGSRETPKEFLNLFSRVARYLASEGAILRSGHAPGADTSFEVGCDSIKGNKEIYLPWKEFQGSTSTLIVRDRRAFEIAKRFHFNWDRLSQGKQKLHARNSHQVLGQDLNTPSKFIICWTRGGEGQGGTGQALRIAEKYDIPVFDCGNYSDINTCRKDLYEFLKLHMAS